MEQILDRYRGSRVSATVSYTERKRIIENRPRFFQGKIIDRSLRSKALYTRLQDLLGEQ